MIIYYSPIADIGHTRWPRYVAAPSVMLLAEAASHDIAAAVPCSQDIFFG